MSELILQLMSELMLELISDLKSEFIKNEDIKGTDITCAGINTLI